MRVEMRCSSCNSEILVEECCNWILILFLLFLLFSVYISSIVLLDRYVSRILRISKNSIEIVEILENEILVERSRLVENIYIGRDISSGGLFIYSGEDIVEIDWNSSMRLVKLYRLNSDDYVIYEISSGSIEKDNEGIIENREILSG